MKRDERINGRTISWKHWIAVFAVSNILCGGFIFIYYQQSRQDGNETYLALSLLTYMVVGSIHLCFCLEILRRRLLMPPIRRVQEAAHRVAGGDFTVRIAPVRTDGRMDEFELLYKDFNTMTEELASTELLKKDFISNVSHELKTPLAVIQNYVSVLQNEYLSEEERRQYINRIGVESRRLSTLVSDILRLSKLENQKIVVHHASYTLSEQLCRCILGFEQLMDEKEIELDFEPDESIVLTSDAELLDIVWNNLLSNALKFSRQGGTVRVSMQKQAKSVAVAITDHGCGIGERALEHIFDKFYQEDASHATKGNGLGLAMVQQIVALLGAEIAVESTLNVGTRFTVTLPLNG